MKTLVAVALAMFSLAAAGEPALSSITPASGSVSGGEYVHIHGSDLQLVPLPCFTPCVLKVTFGGVEAQVVSDTDQEIVVVAPPHAAGAVDVEVVLATKGAAAIANGYRYEAPLLSDNIRFLAPIVINAPGAAGSNWVSELHITNASVENLTVGSSVIAPQTAATIALAQNVGAGAFFSVPKRIADRVTATLRVHDTTRDAESFGTDIPVVPETQFRPSVLIPNVPSDARFRTLLRIYAAQPFFLNAEIAIRDDATGELLASQQLVMTSYAQVAIDSIAGHARLRVEVTDMVLGASAAPAIPIWAFVAVTNNTTQQVTTILPSQMPSPAAVSALATGHWGGGGSCVEVTQTDVSLANGCATGHFFRPPALIDGHFEADGTYTVSVGPPAIGPGQPAHFSGTVQGNDLLLVVTRPAGPQFALHVTLGSTSSCTPPCP